VKAILDTASIEIEEDISLLVLYGFGVYSSFIISDGGLAEHGQV